MKTLKNKARKLIYIFLKFNGMQVSLSFAMLILIVSTDLKNIDWVEASFFSAIVFAAVLEVFGHSLSILFLNRLEDAIKLTDDYDALSKRYNNVKLYSFCNEGKEKRSCATLKRLYKKQYKDKNSSVYQSNIFKFPITDVIDITECIIVIEDKENANEKTNMYELPEDIKGNYNEIIQAHKTSDIYNQLNVRADSWKKEGRTFTIKTSRTTYFDSMVTNRAMDFKWSNGATVREKYEYPPIWHSLEESVLSNHLGFNGFIKSSDGYVVFVKRNKGLSIGKNTYGNSVGASLKTKYALDREGKLNVNGLNKSILCEIYDELKIKEEDLFDFSLERNILYAYRDMVEGGKPQLLFYAESKLSKQEIENNFKRQSKKKKNIHLTDGKKLLWIKIEDLFNVCVTAERIIYKGKSYVMVPSASACVGMLIDYLIK